MATVILVTAGNKTQANQIADALVRAKLAACVNIVDTIRSVYMWEGKVCRDREVLLVIKTRKKLFRKVEAMVRKLHTYDVPEVIALPITSGSKAYLEWIGDVTK